MAIKSGFFNSVNGDRKYNADDISNYFLKLISNGVFATPANAMQVQSNNGMSVQVSAGWGFINCRWINNTSSYTLTLDAADLALNRIDRVVMRLDTANRNITIAVKKGTVAASPTAPELTRVAGGIWELSLAKITVSAGTTAITQAMITDERANTNLCGWVTGLIDQIDTTNLFAQYDNAFNTWFANVKNTLSSAIVIKSLTQRYVTTTANEYSIPINISSYVPDLDILNVYVNGMRLIRGVEYLLNTSTKRITLFTPLDVVGTVVEFEVLKSMDGTGAESVTGDVVDLMERMGGLSLKKMSRADYDLITHDADTIYFVVEPDSAVTMYIGDIALMSGGLPTANVSIMVDETPAGTAGHGTIEEV